MRTFRTFIFILFILVISVLGVSAYDSCHNMDLCYNQDGNHYCSEEDATCMFSVHENNDGCQVVEIEEDLDGDGWSESCDAYPENPQRWFWTGPEEDSSDNREDDAGDSDDGSKASRKKSHALFNKGEVFKVPPLNKSKETVVEPNDNVGLSKEATKESEAPKEDVIIMSQPTYSFQKVAPAPKDKNFPWYILVLILASMWWALKSEDAAEIFRESQR